jgi:hypothetical protein
MATYDQLMIYKQAYDLTEKARSVFAFIAVCDSARRTRY